MISGICLAHSGGDGELPCYAATAAIMLEGHRPRGHGGCRLPSRPVRVLGHRTAAERAVAAAALLRRSHRLDSGSQCWFAVTVRSHPARRGHAGRIGICGWWRWAIPAGSRDGSPGHDRAGDLRGGRVSRAPLRAAQDEVAIIACWWPALLV